MSALIAFKSILILSCIAAFHGFAPTVHHSHLNTVRVSMTSRSGNEYNTNNHHDEQKSDTDSNIHTQQNKMNMMDRRRLFSDAAIKTASVAGVVLSTFPSMALAEEVEPTQTPTPTSSAPVSSKAIGSDLQSPISIIGAGGKVGSLCTTILNKQGLYTRAITRSGRQTVNEQSDFVSYASGDVTSYETIKKAVQGSSGVIFAASASGKKKGGDPEHVDYLGLYNTAKVRRVVNTIKYSEIK